MKSANRVEWEADPELTRHYGEQCRELHIMLIDDDIENVFPSSYAWWTATERKCWGDGVSATRRTAAKPSVEPWPHCGNECPGEDITNPARHDRRSKSSKPAVA
jgi:hypothetical protein